MSQDTAVRRNFTIKQVARQNPPPGSSKKKITVLKEWDKILEMIESGIPVAHIAKNMAYIGIH